MAYRSIHLPSHYQDLSPLASGGMGSLLRARDTRTGRWVALKTARVSTPEEERVLLREARTLGLLSHPGVVQLLDFGVAADRVYYSMELVRGRCLEPFLSMPVPTAEEIRWILLVLLKVLDALEYVHSQGVLHRDLKPSNVLIVQRDGSDRDAGLEELVGDADPRIKLVDFGLAIGREESWSGASEAAGTPLYMPPEQIQAEPVDERSDLYSLGALLYHLVTRRAPFPDLASIVSPRVRPILAREIHPVCPEPLSRLLETLLSRLPHHRPSSAAAVRDEITGLLDTSPRERRACRPRLLPASFVGRSAEQDQIITAVRRVKQGRGTCLRLVGPRGVGKTWLLRRSGLLGRIFAEHGLRYVYHSLAGRNDEGLATLLAQMESTLHDDGSRTDGLAQKSFRSAWRELAEAECAADDTGSIPRAERLLQASTDFLRTTAASGRWLLIVEDVDHADDLELAVLRRWARVVDELAVALVLTWSTPLSGHTSLEQFDAELSRAGFPAALELEGLSDGETRDLVVAMLEPRAALSDDLSAAVARASDGQPLRAAHHLQYLWDRAALCLEDGTWRLSEKTAADASQSTMWRQRRDRLQAVERRVVAAAAVLDVPCRDEFLASVLELDSTQRLRLPSVLRHLARAGLLEEDEDGCFSLPGHADTSVLVEGVPPSRLARWHERAATLLKGRKEDRSFASMLRIARHLEASGHRDEACETFARAGRLASARYANRLACDALERAVALARDPDAESRYHEELGCVRSRVGNHEGALEAFQKALDLHRSSGEQGGSDDDGAALRRDVCLTDSVARVLQRRGDLDSALDLYRGALTKARQLDDLRALALFRLGSVHLERSDYVAARDLLAQSSELYERLGNHARLAEVQSHLGLLAKRQDLTDAAIEHFQSALSNARKSGDLLRVATTLNNLGNLHRSRGDDRTALELLEQSLSERERCGDRQGLAICLNNVSRVHCFRGEYRRGSARTRQALRLFEELGDPKGVGIATCNLGEILYVLGEFEEAREVLHRTLEVARRWRLPPVEAAALVNLAVLDTEYGDYERSLAVLDQAMDHPLVQKPCELRAIVLGATAGAAILSDDLLRAETALSEALDISTKLNLQEMKGTLISQEVRLHVAQGDLEEAHAAGSPWLKAPRERMARYGYAQLLREMGRVYRELGPDWADRTESLLERALVEFERMESPHNIAETLAECAIYWSLVGDETEVERRARDARAAFGERPLTPRLRALLCIYDDR